MKTLTKLTKSQEKHGFTDRMGRETEDAVRVAKETDSARSWEVLRAKQQHF